jgi:hypothetical protein
MWLKWRSGKETMHGEGEQGDQGRSIDMEICGGNEGVFSVALFFSRRMGDMLDLISYVFS